MFENCSHSSRRLFSAAAAAGVLIFVLAALVFALHTGSSRLTETAGRCAWLAALGYEADGSSEELRDLVLPESFDAVMERYNALQLAQGFDLRPYAGKPCLCCSYDLVGYPGWDGRVIATLYIRHGRLIGGDIHTAAADGFMAPLLPDPNCDDEQKNAALF